MTNIMQEKAQQTVDGAKAPVVPSMALASIVADRVEITDVRIVETVAWCNVVDSAEPSIQLRLEMSVKTSLRDGKYIEVFPRFAVIGAQLSEPNKPAEDVLRIEARFRLHYDLGSADGLTAEQLDSFGQLNGVYNAWPYWREFAQSTSVRMGLPPLTLAVFRLPRAEE